jgi:hypothetical protein
MRDIERHWRLVIVSRIECWCNARHRSILEACDCFDDRVLMQREAPNDIGGLWLFWWTSIDAARGTGRYWRLVLVSMIEYWYSARHRSILEACDCIDDRLLVQCEAPIDIGGLWLYRGSCVDVMRDTERYGKHVIVWMVEYYWTSTYWMIGNVYYIDDRVSMKLLLIRYW